MKKLWQKEWILNSDVELFETQSDIEYDKYLLPFDLVASYAHAKMLCKIKIISSTELEVIQHGLTQILQLDTKDQFSLQFGEEDIHSKIENYLTDNYGEVGKKIHTGRSRNDQVLTALRLFSKQEIFSIEKEVLNTANSFCQFAQKYEFIPMPGYTHLQKAMPSSFGMWTSSFAEGLYGDSLLLQSVCNLLDQSPLGSGASYGVPLNLDREFTAQLLGFAKVQNNSLYCQNSRGKFEAVILAALNTILFDINKFATDVLLFTTEEFNLLHVDSTLCSGSSIMPQKKNVDIAELLRSKIHVVMGNYVQIISMSSNLTSGYNRDLQDTKKPLIESLLLTKQCLLMTQSLLSKITPNVEHAQAQLTANLFSTHHAFELLAKGIPFRDAYMQAALALGKNEVPIPKNYSHLSQHTGGTGNLQLAATAKLLAQETASLKVKQDFFHLCLSDLLPLENLGGTNESSSQE